jgi:CRISPR-associated protein Cst2
MAYLAGLIVLDAPASALNNAGADVGARTDNVIAVKRIRTSAGTLPYVSAQAFRYWWRTTAAQESAWVAAPVFREAKIAYSDANPIENWDDDLFGYMRAPSKKADAASSEAATPLEKDREITRVSPVRVSTFLAVAPSPIVMDYGTMTRQNGDPVPYEHEFYRAHLRGLLSIDLTSAGTFYDSERVGIKNMDSHRRDAARKAGCAEVGVRGQKAWRLPIEQRRCRVATLLSALVALNGGAKQALHYTDLTPAIVALAVIRHANNPFYRMLGASRTHETTFHRAAFDEALAVYERDFLSDIYLGWAENFLDDERAACREAIEVSALKDRIHLAHPVAAIRAMATTVAAPASEEWFA